MSEIQVASVADKSEKKLKKDEFNATFRFREARKEGLVTCASCVHMAGGINRDEVAYCQHPERSRKIKIAEYWGGGGWGGKGTSNNISSARVCDAYTNEPLPDGVVVPTIPEKSAALLGTQWRDPYHGDSHCPYVIEEQRIIHNGGRTKMGRTGEIFMADISEMVSGETIRDICEMPCCESKLPFQICCRNDYRQKVGIKPDGSEPRVWVRNGIVKHEMKSNIGVEEAESFFNLTEIVSRSRDTCDRIVAVSNYMYKNCNALGSRPLSEANNPVGFSNRHHFFEGLWSPQDPEFFWAYDERLFDRKTKIETLERIPEGFILCLDSQGYLGKGMSVCQESSPQRFWAHGIIKPLEEDDLISKGISHYLDIREVHYHDSGHMWGEFGNGFSGLASFDAE